MSPRRADPIRYARPMERFIEVAGALEVSDVVQAARRLESAAPNARAVIWRDVAHMIGMEVPGRLNGLIVDFVGPLRPWE